MLRDTESVRSHHLNSIGRADSFSDSEHTVRIFHIINKRFDQFGKFWEIKMLYALNLDYLQSQCF